MNRTIPLLLVFFLLLSTACLGEEAKKAGMTLDTKLAEVRGALNSTEITASEFMELNRSGERFVLIDVRTDVEYNSGYIPGAVNIPYTELDKRIGELNLSKNDLIVVYCEAGVRSKKGANALLNLGFTNIVDVTDGMKGWRALGGELNYPKTSDAVSKEEGGLESPAPLIAAGVLRENIGSYKVIFLGTANQYVDGHIPGALYINPLTDLIDPDSEVPYLVLKEADFAALMSRLGVDPEDALVAYDDQPDHKYASRLFWILKLYGHERASVLDGGLSAWIASGGGLSTEQTQIKPSFYSVLNVNKDILAAFTYVKDSFDNPGVRLVEATTPKEFETEGHIPGAILVEPEETLNSDGTFKGKTELLTFYASMGITRDNEIITYCHTGYRGSVIWFELKHILNYPNVRLYDGSLEEWNLNKMPLEFGSPEKTTTTKEVVQTTTTTLTTTSTLTPAPKEESYLDVKPKMVFEKLDGDETVHMNMWETIKVEDSYIYITGDFNGCLGLVWWTFNIYHDTPSGGVWEGKTTFSNYEVHDGQDISDKIHRVSDAMDNYQIVIKRWSVAEGLTIEISR